LSNNFWIGTIPLLLVTVAGALVLGMIVPATNTEPSQRLMIFLGVTVIVAASVMVPNSVVRSAAAILLTLAAIVGAASIGLFYLPAIAAAVYAARYQFKLNQR
jgi:hypothetical protein